MENSIWAVGYFSSTIGLNEEQIRKYIDNHGKEEETPDLSPGRMSLHLANTKFSFRLSSALLAHFKHDPKALFAASDNDLGDVAGLQSRHLVRIADRPAPR